MMYQFKLSQSLLSSSLLFRTLSFISDVTKKKGEEINLKRKKNKTIKVELKSAVVLFALCRELLTYRTLGVVGVAG